MPASLKTQTDSSVMPQKTLAGLLLTTLSALAGCMEAPSSLTPSRRSSSSELEIRTVESPELDSLVANADRPLLVEFSVLSGCYRCDNMRSPIRRKAVEILKHAEFVRIDFNFNKSLAQQVGATVCPSYVVYSRGQVVSVRTWPTSADLVATDVAAARDQARTD